MTAPRLRSVTVRGFRAFGRAEQTLNTPSDLAVVWGPNSKGKTSLAEAVEFLLTGRISRRELTASAQDEFADALRNAHLGDGDQVYVAARLMGSDSAEHDVRRILLRDYAKREDCHSRLMIDDAPASEQALATLGLTLSQPPLDAPVLTQHTLGYIFSVRPQDRAAYFKALLEVTDLDDLRAAIAALADVFPPPIQPLLSKFDACLAVPAFSRMLASVAAAVPDSASLDLTLARCALALIEGAGRSVPDNMGERLRSIEAMLADRRSKVFPIQAFTRVDLDGWRGPAARTWAALDTYLLERRKVDAHARQLRGLLDEVLRIPGLSSISHPIDCPVCGSAAALTPDRVTLLRLQVERTDEFARAEAAAREALGGLALSAEALVSVVDSALPDYLKSTPAARRVTGFTLARIRGILGGGAADLLSAWLTPVRSLARAAGALRRAARAAHALVQEQALADEGGFEPATLRAVFDDLAASYAALATAVDSYRTPAEALVSALNEPLASLSDTQGWQEFLDIALQPKRLRGAMIDREAVAALRKEIASALAQIDRAKEQVLDDKFADYSDLVQQWWDRLRPDEPTFFSAVGFRKGAKRTIDFKAGLSATPDRSAPKLRDVIAVFSQSQLHCLGLSLFLARAQREGLGFVVLDDPVLSSDEDYRAHFNSTVLSALLDLPMQVIVLTQDHSTWKEIEIRYRHARVATAQLFVEAPAEGAIIDNTSDALLAKLSRATSLARGGHPDSRKECGIHLRDAGERFCKEVLVNDRRSRGDATASLGDYEGKTLEWLCPHVDPLLGKDPSHPGKLEVFRNTVNRACHDNAPPGTAEMTMACGELRRFVKDYLGR